MAASRERLHHRVDETNFDQEEKVEKVKARPGFLRKCFRYVKTSLSDLKNYVKTSIGSSGSVSAQACSGDVCSIVPRAGRVASVPASQTPFSPHSVSPFSSEKKSPGTVNTPQYTNSSSVPTEVIPGRSLSDMLGDLKNNPVSFWSLVLILPEECINELAKHLKRSDTEIFCMDQTLRAVALFFLAKSLPTPVSLAIPAASFLFTKKYGSKINDENKAGNIALVLTIAALLLLEGPEVLLAIGAGMTISRVSKAGMFGIKNYTPKVVLDIVTDISERYVMSTG